MPAMASGLARRFSFDGRGTIKVIAMETPVQAVLLPQKDGTPEAF